MAADTSLTLGKETRKRLLSLVKTRGAGSAAEVVRDLINEAYDRANPPLAVGFFLLDARGDVGEPACAQCEQVIARDQQMYAVLMSNETIIAPLCESCANTD